MNKDYTPTDLERDLIEAFWLLFPHAKHGDNFWMDKTCRSVGAIGHELYTSLNSHGFKIKIDPILVQNRRLDSTDEAFFTQIHCAGDLLSKLPHRAKFDQ